jgi:glycine/D-amino acid oxidase-like deaminating enzyme
MLNYSVVGGGISGLMTAWFLHKQNRLSRIYVSPKKQSASGTAAGLLNPITGKRFAKTWMADSLFPFAFSTYSDIEKELGATFIELTKVLRFAENTGQLNDWHGRTTSDAFIPYISDETINEEFIQNFQPQTGFFFIKGAMKINVAVFMNEIYNYFQQLGYIIEEDFADFDTDENVVFCEGIEALNNPYFNTIPLIGVKGHYLVCEIKDLNLDVVAHGKATIIPDGKDRYRVGSTYQWEYTHDAVEDDKVSFLEQGLQETIRLPYKILDVLTGIRPASRDRRPIIGKLSALKNHYTLNGLGTKGYSLAPYFANQLVNHILHQNPIDKEVSVNRFLPK